LTALELQGGRYVERVRLSRTRNTDEDADEDADEDDAPVRVRLEISRSVTQ
jgi:hypothetical protein